MNILCGVSYDGSDFSGWQVQPGKITVQSVIEEILTKLYGTKLKIVGSGRTDSGVHAFKNYFNFKLEKSKIPINKLCYVLNNLMPHSIRILSAREVPETFNSRYNASRRIYEYYISIGEVSPFLRNYRLFLKKNLDVEKMNAAAKLLIGTNDFSGFKAVDCKSKNQVRTVYSSWVKKNLNEIIIHIEANAFLKNMVRIITGTLIDVGKNKNAPEIISEIIFSKDRRKAGKTVSPAGLFLLDVIIPGLDSASFNYNLQT